MKRKILPVLALLVCAMVSASGSDSCEWTDYVGNPQRTAYTACDGPDNPFVLWKISRPGAFDTSPFLTDDTVLILWDGSTYHTLEVEVLLLDILTGETLQKFNQQRYLFSEVFPVGEKIVGIDGRRLYEIDLTTKNITLLTEIPEEPVRFSSTYHGSLRNNVGTIFHYTYNNYPVLLTDKIIIPTIPTVCLSQSDFSMVWNLENAAPGFHTHNAVGDELSVVFIVEKKGFTQLLSVDSSTGILQWMSDPLSAAYWLALGKDTIYCGGKNLWVFDRGGSKLWEFTPEERIVSNIVAGPDAVYIADGGGNLYKLDLQGNLIWKTEWEGSPYFQSHLIGAGDTLFCIENVGDDAVEPSGSQVAAYDMEDGTKIWSMEFGNLSWVKYTPAMARGVLVVGTMYGEVIALASDPSLFLEQGDIFLSRGLKDQAIISYKMAAELYEKEGDLNTSQRVQEKVYELENQLESKTPESPPSIPPESSLGSPSFFIPVGITVLAIALSGIYIVYHFMKHEKISG